MNARRERQIERAVVQTSAALAESMSRAHREVSRRITRRRMERAARRSRKVLAAAAMAGIAVAGTAAAVRRLRNGN